MELQNKVRLLLKDFVSDAAVSDIYAALLLHGPQTISALARTSGVERTRIYRSLHELQALQLVEIELHPHRQIIHAASITNLQNMVAAKRSALDILSTDIASFQKEYSVGAGVAAATKVQFYKGTEGIEQMLWNQTKAGTVILSMLSENIQSHAGKAFFERWVDRCNQRGLQSRSLVDDSFLQAQKQWYGDVTGHSLQKWSARKMPADISGIPHRTTVYDNVTTYFSWQDGDPFGIEIYNQNIADNQRQYFELLWLKSAPLTAS
jgi:DNA-binding MarR family transcriptional regulator